MWGALIFKSYIVRVNWCRTRQPQRQVGTVHEDDPPLSEPGHTDGKPS
jgi:hypothetical protein